MSDCSKTEVFLSEYERMCSCMYSDEDEVFCRECPAHEFISSDTCDTEDLKRLYKVVQKWSDEHPAPKPKTYADVFCERLQKTPDSSRWKEVICRRMIWRGKCLKNETTFDSAAYVGACIECWNEPYKEDE